jgi:hypothetical protein
MTVITQGAGIGLTITVNLSTFPNVPKLPGVPQLARSVSVPTGAGPTAATEAQQDALWNSANAPPVWGVFSQPTGSNPGAIVIDADSVLDFGWRVERKVSRYAVQTNSFASYNKVFLPFETSVNLRKTGNADERKAFLDQIDAVVDSFDLVNIKTTEKTYMNVNCTRAELMRRGPENANIIDVELYFDQIATVDAQYSATGATPTTNASVASAVPAVNQGTVQAQPASTQVATQATAAIQTLDPITVTGTR